MNPDKMSLARHFERDGGRARSGPACSFASWRLEVLTSRRGFSRYAVLIGFLLAWAVVGGFRLPLRKVTGTAGSGCRNSALQREP